MQKHEYSDILSVFGFGAWFRMSLFYGLVNLIKVLAFIFLTVKIKPDVILFSFIFTI